MSDSPQPVAAAAFDPSKPFSKIKGHPQAAFRQGDTYFDPGHNPVDMEAEQPAPVVNTAEDPSTTRTKADPDEPPKVVEPPSWFDLQTQLDQIGKSTLDELTWGEVRRIVRAAGGEYLDKAQGLAYLRALGGAQEAPAAGEGTTPAPEGTPDPAPLA